MMTEAESDLERLNRALAGCQELQELALKYGIPDIFQDNGGKVLQTLIILGLKAKGSREGNDAVDDEGNEYELKTVNIALGKSRGITTHHHLNFGILDKYRKVAAWYIALYDGITLQSIYRLTPAQLEPFFSGWEQRLRATGVPINNPKIPLRFVLDSGSLVYPTLTQGQAVLLPPSSPLKPDED
jgi:hypothetical protein